MKITMSPEELRKLVKSPIAGYVVAKIDDKSYRTDEGEQVEMTLEPIDEKPVAMRAPATTPDGAMVVDMHFLDVEPKCDGNHAMPICASPECWQR